MSENTIPVQPDEVALSDDDIMRFTQGTRKRFVDEMMEGGFPKENKDRTTLLMALADMDRTALGNKRIGATERRSAADALVATTLSRLQDSLGERNPFEGKDTPLAHLPEINQALLPDADPVPGETDIGISNTDYDTLMKETDND